MTEKKKFPIGTQDLKKIFDDNAYYVDKTPFIKSVINHDADVLLITRPRRFGKTLFMNTLARFFALDVAQPGNLDSQLAIFPQTEIYKDQVFCQRYMGQYPVIFLSLKRAYSESGFKDAYLQLVDGIQTQCDKHRYLADSTELSPLEKTNFQQLLNADYLKNLDNQTAVQNSLEILVTCLSKHHHRQVILLIDEYDVPLAKAVQYGYYDKMIGIIRPLLENALKPDPVTEAVYLEKAVITGCLRVSKESIFTGLNNPGVNTVCTDDSTLNEALGFTAAEVTDMLRHYQLEDKADIVKKWYDGYRFGSSEIYCPWDLINYCSDITKKPSLRPINYWTNTSGDNPVKDYLGFLSGEDTDKMQALVDGKSIEIKVNEHLNYNTLADHRSDDFWSLLLFTGYLTIAPDAINNDNVGIRAVRIPNEEIRHAFESGILEFFSQTNIRYVQRGKTFVDALFSGNPDTVAEVLTPLLSNYVSIRDTATKAPAENFYHGFLSGLLTSAGISENDMHSNPEAGNGYADLILTHGVGSLRIGVIIELKHCTQPIDIYDAADSAVEQIKDKRYTDFLRKMRCRKHIVYGIAFCRKTCAVSGGAVPAAADPQLS